MLSVPWRGEISDMAIAWMRYDGRLRRKNCRDIVRRDLMAVAVARQLKLSRCRTQADSQLLWNIVVACNRCQYLISDAAMILNKI